MKSHRSECIARSERSHAFVDLTDEVQGTLSSSGIKDGQVTVFLPEEGCSLIVNERESGLLVDLERALERLQIGSGRGAGSMIGSSSVVLPAVGGELRLGTWQRVLLVELEAPAERRVVVQILGE